MILDHHYSDIDEPGRIPYINTNYPDVIQNPPKIPLHNQGHSGTILGKAGIEHRRSGTCK